MYSFLFSSLLKTKFSKIFFVETSTKGLINTIGNSSNLFFKEFFSPFPVTIALFL